VEALAALRGELDALAAAGGEADALRAFAERPEVARVLARFAPEGEGGAAGAPAAAAPEAPKKRVWRLGRQELAARQTPRVYTSADGLEIWVGRNDESNDLLSTRLARGNDLFFHLDASPGSHVVLRTEGRPDPPSTSILDACELAVHFSKARNAPSADVLVAPIKNVRKPKGAKPGLVFVSGGRHVRLRRDPTRLARLLRGDGDVPGDPAIPPAQRTRRSPRIAGSPGTSPRSVTTRGWVAARPSSSTARRVKRPGWAGQKKGTPGSERPTTASSTNQVMRRPSASATAENGISSSAPSRSA
jgi:hypothetical protein